MNNVYATSGAAAAAAATSLLLAINDHRSPAPLRCARHRNKLKSQRLAGLVTLSWPVTKTPVLNPPPRRDFYFRLHSCPLNVSLNKRNVTAVKTRVFGHLFWDDLVVPCCVFSPPLSAEHHTFLPFHLSTTGKQSQHHFLTRRDFSLAKADSTYWEPKPLPPTPTPPSEPPRI